MIEGTILSFYNYGARNNRAQCGEQKQCSLFTKAEAEAIKKGIKNLIADSKVEDDDLVYFHNSSMIPRYKFLNYCADKKARRVINYEKANKIVINKQTLDGQIASNFGHIQNYIILPYDYFKSCQGMMAPAPVKEGEFYFIQPTTYKELNKVATLADISSFPKEDLSYSYRRSDEENKALLEITKLLELGIPLVPDAVLNKQMAETGIVINEENYDEINSMLASTDNAVKTTAMELLANSNYEESIFYISLLLNGNISTVNAVGNKGVNIKNFLEYFRDVQWHSNPMNFLTSLREKLFKEKKLDRLKDDYLHKNALDHVNKYIGNKGLVVDSVSFRENPRELAVVHSLS